MLNSVFYEEIRQVLLRFIVLILKFYVYLILENIFLNKNY